MGKKYTELRAYEKQVGMGNRIANKETYENEEESQAAYERKLQAEEADRQRWLQVNSRINKDRILPDVMNDFTKKRTGMSTLELGNKALQDTIIKKNREIRKTNLKERQIAQKMTGNDISLEALADEYARRQLAGDQQEYIPRSAYSYSKETGQGDYKYSDYNLSKYFDRANYLANKGLLTDEEKKEAKSILDASNTGIGGVNSFTKRMANDPEMFNSWDSVLQKLEAKTQNPFEAAITGFIGSVAGSADKAVRSSIENTTGYNNPYMSVNEVNAYGNSDHKTASTIGNIAGNVAVMDAISSVFPVDVSKMTPFGRVAAQSLKNSATFAIKQIYDDMGSIASGEVSLEDGIKKAAISGTGGLAGGVASSLVGSGIAKILVDKGLMTPFMEFVRGTASSMASSAANIGTSYALSEEKPTKEQVANQLVSSFLLSAIQNAVSAMTTSAQMKAQMEKNIKDMSEQYSKMEKAYFTANAEGDKAAAAESAKAVLSYTASIKKAYSNQYIPGQQKIVNELMSACEGIEERCLQIIYPEDAGRILADTIGNADTVADTTALTKIIQNNINQGVADAKNAVSTVTPVPVNNLGNIPNVNSFNTESYGGITQQIRDQYIDRNFNAAQPQIESIDVTKPVEDTNLPQSIETNNVPQEKVPTIEELANEVAGDIVAQREAEIQKVENSVKEQTNQESDDIIETEEDKKAKNISGRLSVSNSVIENGFEYNVTSDGNNHYYATIYRNYGGLRNARGMYNGGPFNTRDEAVNTVVSVAKNNGLLSSTTNNGTKTDATVDTKTKNTTEATTSTSNTVSTKSDTKKEKLARINVVNRYEKLNKKNNMKVNGVIKTDDGKSIVANNYLIIKTNYDIEGAKEDTFGEVGVKDFLLNKLSQVRSDDNTVINEGTIDINELNNSINSVKKNGEAVILSNGMIVDRRPVDGNTGVVVIPSTEIGPYSINSDYLKDVLSFLPDASIYAYNRGTMFYFTSKEGEAAVCSIHISDDEYNKYKELSKQHSNNNAQLVKYKENGNESNIEEISREPVNDDARLDQGSGNVRRGSTGRRNVSDTGEVGTQSGSLEGNGNTRKGHVRDAAAVNKENESVGSGRISSSGNSEGLSNGNNESGSGGLDGKDTSRVQENVPVKEKKKKRNTHNYHITEDIDNITPNFNDNYESIKLVKKLIEENRPATNEERAILAKYKGWGALKADVLTGYHADKLKELLTPEEYETAKDSILNAHYTSTKVIDGIYKAVQRMGFSGGNILEPSMGVGNFFGMLPKNLSDNSDLYGVELDHITGTIAKNLYPDANINVSGYQDVLFGDGTFDLVVGNVPFSNDIKIPYRGSKYNLHDFFFVKALDETRPGGIVALITSTGTLDKISGKAKNDISKKANLIAAFRLPDNAFKSNAGTSVTTDLIFLQKKGNGITDNGVEFTEIGSIDGIPINEYYVNHPKNILGTLAYEKGMYATERTVVHATPDFEEKFNKAINSLPKDIMSGESNNTDTVKVSKRGQKNKNTFVVTGDGVKIKSDTGETQNVSSKQEDMIKRYVEIKNTYFAIADAEQNGNLEAANDYRKSLNQKYDYFTKKYGSLEKNKRILGQDDEFLRVSGLEIVSKNNVEKSAIFDRPTMYRDKKTSAATSSEGLSIVLNEKGNVDVDEIATLTGKTKEEVIKDLEDEIILTPDGDYVLTPQYLSGNIYEKLEAVKGKKGFEKQEKLLEAKIPTPKTADKIDAEISSHWIPEKYINEFIKDEFSIYGDINAHYIEEAGKWDFGKFWSPITKWKTNRVSQYDLLINTMNNKNIEIYDKDIKGNRVFNQEETEIAQNKQNDLRKAFREWIFKDADRRKDLEDIFNRTLNAYSPMDYNALADKLDYEIDPNSGKQLRDYQKAAVARIVFGGNTLLHHGVGTGKTLTMIAAAHVLKKTGISNKPMFVVPNGKVNDFKNEILGVYPGAKILALDADLLSPKEIKKTKAIIATNDWDYVLVHRSGFQKIGVSKETEAAFIERQIIDLENAIRQFSGSKEGSTRFEKSLITKKKNLEEKLKLLLSKPKDDSTTFENMGIDSLFIDEAHNFKKVGFATTHEISGVDSSTNVLTTDLYMKEEWLRDRSGRIVLATATPITNTVSEMYNMTLHVNPDILREAGVYAFDGWLNTFGDIKSAAEIASDGKTFRIKERVQSFKNGNELISLYRQFADVKQTKDVVKGLPEAKEVTVVCKGSDIHQKLLDSFASRMASVGRGSKDDNALNVNNDARAAATDLRMVYGIVKEYYPDITLEELDLPDSKINKAVENIIDEYHGSTKNKGTQLVFLDSGMGRGNATRYTFNLYGDLIDKLVKNGIPRNEIADIADYVGEVNLQNLYGKVRSGDIRVLIGSTQKMGEGVNVQNKIVALHHLSVPFRADNLEQRNGRGERHGNENPQIRIYKYIQEQSYDSYLWQMIERKSKYMAQALNGGDAGDLEEISDVTVNAQQSKAIATGNPAIMEKFQLENEVSKLKTLERSFYSEVSNAKVTAAQSKEQLDQLKNSLVVAKETAKKLSENKKETFEITIGNKKYDKRKDASEALARSFEKAKLGEKIGSVYGIDITKSFNNKSLNSYGIVFNNDPNLFVELGESAEGNITRILNGLDQIEKLPNRMENAINALVAKIADAEETASKGSFPQEKELSEKLARLNELNRELGITGDKVEINVTSASTEEEPEEEYSRSVRNPSEWKTTRTGDPNKKPDRIPDIINQISTFFGVNIDEGHVRGAGVEGKYSKLDKGIKTKDRNSLPTALHEFGHALCDKYGFEEELKGTLSSELQDALGPRGKIAYDKSLWETEGWAEFIRQFFTNRADCEKKYPKTTEFLLNTLTPEDLARVESLADNVNAYFVSAMENAQGSIISRSEKAPDYRTTKEKIKDAYDQFIIKFVDVKKPIKDVSESAYMLASNAAYVDSIVRRIFENRDLTDWDGKRVGKGLRVVLEDLKLTDKQYFLEFNEYLTCLHGQEWANLTDDDGNPTPLEVFGNAYQDTAEYMKGRCDKLAAMHPEFPAKAKELIEWVDNFVYVYGVQTGLISQELYDKLRAKYPNYLPFFRAIAKEGGSNPNRNVKRSFINQRSPVKKAKGSGALIYYPVENVFELVNQMVNAAVKNRVMQEIVSAYKEGDVDAKDMIKIDVPLVPQTFNLKDRNENILASFMENGGGSDELDMLISVLDQLGDTVTKFVTGRTKGKEFTVMIDGKPEYYMITNNDLFDAVSNVSPPKISPILRAIATTTRFISMTATGGNPIWSIGSNSLRDLDSALFYDTLTKGLTGKLSFLKTMASVYVDSFNESFKEGKSADPLYLEYLALGGGHASVNSFGKDYATDYMKTYNKNKFAKLLYNLRPDRMIEWLSDTIETGPRAATYKLARQAGYDPQEAYRLGMEITVDFRRYGSVSKQVNNAAQFFNANIQGTYKFYQHMASEDIKDKNERDRVRKKRIAAYIARSAIMAAIFALMYRKNKKAYDRLSNYTKNSYYCIPIGDDKWITIPKNRELSALDSFLERVIELSSGDNDAFDEYYTYFTGTFLPSIVSDIADFPYQVAKEGLSEGWRNTRDGILGSLGMFGIMSNMSSNRDFLGRPIEPASLEDTAPENRYNGKTSKFAKLIGEVLHISPMMIDYLGTNVLGWLYKAQKALAPVDMKNFDPTLGLANTYVRDSLYSTDITNDIYDLRDKQELEFDRKDSVENDMKLKLTDRLVSFYGKYNKLDKEVSDRATRRKVLDQIQDYLDYDYKFSSDPVLKVIYENSLTDYLPSVMETELKNGDTIITLKPSQYYEYQSVYCNDYYSYAEATLKDGMNRDEIKSVLKYAKERAKSDATDHIKKQIFKDYVSDEKYSNINATDTIRFRSKLDKANEDGSITNDEVMDIALEMIREGTSDDVAGNLYQERTDDKHFSKWAGSTEDYLNYKSDLSDLKAEMKNKSASTNETRDEVVDRIKSYRISESAEKILFELAGYSVDAKENGKVVEDGNFDKYFH